MMNDDDPHKYTKVFILARIAQIAHELSKSPKIVKAIRANVATHAAQKHAEEGEHAKK